MESTIKWQTGKPKRQGFYIITNVFDVIDLAYFHNKWHIYNEQEIIAWCSTESIEPYKKENEQL